jgi:hypothetical protein
MTRIPAPPGRLGLEDFEGGAGRRAAGARGVREEPDAGTPELDRVELFDGFQGGVFVG